MQKGSYILHGGVHPAATHPIPGWACGVQVGFRHLDKVALIHLSPCSWAAWFTIASLRLSHNCTDMNTAVYILTI